jgi:hypothetical protein
VFFGSNLPAFSGTHLNLNGPHWPAAKVFYAIDPGAGEREKWTARLGKPRWVVLNYDSQAKLARVESSVSP